jgi:hypothetical protein
MKNVEYKKLKLTLFAILLFHFSLFILLPSPFGEGLGVRLLILIIP